MSSNRVLEQFVQVRRKLNLLYTQRLRDIGIGTKQAAIIRHLANHGSCSLSEVSRATGTDMAAMVRAVNSLMKTGWIVRKENPNDRRCWFLTLTPRYKKQVGAIREAFDDIAAKLVKPLSGTERKQFLKLLEKIYGSLKNEEVH